MRGERKPAEPDRLGVEIGGVHRHILAGFGLEVVDKIAVITPLVRVHIPEARGVLQTRGLGPVLSHGNGGPGCQWHHFFLTDIVGQTGAVPSDAPGQNQGSDSGPVDQVVVIPMIDTGANDDHVAAGALFAVHGPFAGNSYQGLGGDARIFFLPGGCKRFVILVVCRIIASQAARNSELAHEKVEDGRNRNLPIFRHDTPDRDIPENITIGLEGETDRTCSLAQVGQAAVDICAVHHVNHIQVPVPLLLAPA